MYKEKIYAKCFRIYNDTGTFTEEDFNLLKEKFDIIKKLYFNDMIERDVFKSFREIVREVKRAAHNAGLTAELIKAEYHADFTSIMACNTSDNEVGINLIVTFKKFDYYNPKMKREFSDFIITKFLGFPEIVTLSSNQTVSIIIDDDMRYYDDDIIYDFEGEEV